MNVLQDLVSSGRIVDFMLLYIVLETAVLAWRGRGGRGLPLALLLTNAGAGGSLMLALKAALAGWGWIGITAFLLLSLVFHVADLLTRARERARRTGAPA